MTTVRVIHNGATQDLERADNWSDVEWQRFLSLEVRLQIWLHALNKKIKVTIIDGQRSKALQLQYIKEGKSKTSVEKAKHCKEPKSFAVDIGPDPLDWKATNAFYYLGGYGKALAAALNIPIRWGGDFNRNNIVTDETFLDLVHFEIDEN